MQRLRAIEKDQTIGALDKRGYFLFADQVLGLELDRAPEVQELSAEQEDLLQRRINARAEKNWAESDALRSHLESEGIEISDGAEGQSWRWK